MKRASTKQQFKCRVCQELAKSGLGAHVRPGKQALAAAHGGHPASSTGEVNVLIQKKAGTELLMQRARVGVRGEWHWLVDGAGRVNFKAGDKYGLRLRDAKIGQPQRTLRIP